MLNRLSSWFGAKTKIVEMESVKLPPDLPNWSLVKDLLHDLQIRLNSENISEQETSWFMQIIYNTIQSDRQASGSREGQLNRLRLQIQSSSKKKLDSSNLWFGMFKYLRKVSSEERNKFLYHTLPNIIEFALAIEKHQPKEPVLISRQQHGGVTKLSRQFICSIVACFFLCLFPERKKDSSKLNIVNLTTFFRHLPQLAQIAKLRCILHYFECIIERGKDLHGNILFCRKVTLPSWLLTFDELVNCDLKLCPLNIQIQGAIEDTGSESIQVCFGNKSVGGGVLGCSTVQEEIRFSTCPELMAAMLFMENMEANEAIFVSGFEQFSACTGFGDSLDFAEHYKGSDQVNTMVTIDAASYRDVPLSKQFEESSVLRDLNKAVIGFSWMPGTDGRAMQQLHANGGGDGSPAAADVAADIVAIAMTDALRQAAESSVHQETSCPLHLHQPQSHQHDNLLFSDESRASLHLPQTSESIAESLKPSVQDISNSTVTFTDNSTDVQFQRCSSHQPSSLSSSSSFIGSVESCQVSLSSAYNKRQFSPTLQKTADVVSADIAAFRSCHLGAVAKSSALIPEDSSFLRSRLICLDNSPLLASDILGNLSTNNMSSVEVTTVDTSVNKYFEDAHSIMKPEQHKEQHTAVNVVIDRQAHDTIDESRCSLLLSVDTEEFKSDELILSNLKIERDDKYDLINSIDVVLSLPALQSEIERVSSGQSNSSMFVSVGSQSLSANSAEEESVRQPVSEVLYINVEHSEFPHDSWKYSTDKMVSDAGASSIDSMHLEPPFSSSPQSSVSSSNVSPNTSFLAPEAAYLEPPNGLSDIHVPADFIESIHSSTQHPSRRGSRDFYGELRDFLSSSSSGSRGSGGPLSSTNSSWGSRSGSISSHGANGSTIDFLEFWSNFRRRSSQLSDAMSRRSSSSKHSSDFSTDLEEISEGVQKHDHGIIEEEESLMVLIAEYALHLVSEIVREGLTEASRLTSSRECARNINDTNKLRVVPKLSTDICEQTLTANTEAVDSKDHTIILLSTDAVKTDTGRLQSYQNCREDSEFMSSGKELSSSSSSIIQQASLDKEGNHYKQNELHVQLGSSSNTISLQSPEKSVSKLKGFTRTPASPIPSTQAVIRCQDSNISLRGQQIYGQPLSSFSLDSGFSSTMSSISITPHLSTVESSSEETSSLSTVNTSISIAPHLSTIESLREETSSLSTVNTSISIAPHLSTIESSSEASGSLFTVSTSLSQSLGTSSLSTTTTDSLLNISLQATSEQCQAVALSTKELVHNKPLAAEQNIPMLKSYNRQQYITLESKTIYFGQTNIPQNTTMPLKEKQFDHSESTLSETSATLIPFNFTPKGHKEISGSTEANLYVNKSDLKLPKSSYAGAAKVLERGLKYFQRQKVEEDNTIQLETKSAQKKNAVFDTSKIAKVTSSCVHHPFNNTTVPSKSSFIPKFKDSIKRLSACSDGSIPSGNKNRSPQKINVSTVKDKHKTGEKKFKKDVSSSLQKEEDKALCRSHKSRYVFSDVAAAPASGRRRKSKTTLEPETCIKRQGEKRTLKKQDDRKRKQKSDSSSHDKFNFIKSQKFIRFVSSIAEMSLSQAVLEGAELLTHNSVDQRGAISDELYNWFATKIVTEVFLYVVKELNQRQNGSVCSSESATVDDAVSDSFQSPAVSKHELAATDTAEPKPKGILPTKPDVSSSKGSGQRGLSGSLKVVKFKDSRLEENYSLPLSHVQSHVTVLNSSMANVSPTFHRNSSNIPVPIRRRNSLDLQTLSPTRVRAASLSLSLSPLSPRLAQENQSFATSCNNVTRKDLSVDIYQAAAAIVNQVLQAVSDTFSTPLISPASSGRYDASSLSDTAVHSTGSKVCNSIASNIFSSSSVKDSPKQTLRPVSPSLGVFSRKPMSRETLTNAFLKVDSTPYLKSYERRSSEPCQTSVQLSLQAFNRIKFSQQSVEDSNKNISRTDDDIGRGKTWRRGSLDGFSFERRNSCGFKDPVLSRFAEELMKADTSVPELVIVGSHPGSSSTGSRRSSLCAYKETTQTNLESDLLNASFTSVCSLPMSHSSHSQCKRGAYMDRSHSRESRNWKSDSSDTEYWFPPPRIVGDEFQQEYNRQHSQEELQDYASFFAGRVVQEAVSVLKCDSEYLSQEEQGVELFAENLMDQIMRDALISTLYLNHPTSMHKEKHINGQTRSTTHHKSSATKIEIDDKKKMYAVQGARPKTSVSGLTQAKSKSLHHRRVSHQLNYHRTENTVNKHAESQIDSGPSRLAIPSQQMSYARFPQRTQSVESPLQDLYFRYNVQEPTADAPSTSSRLKRHSTPSSASSSLPPTFTKPPSSLSSSVHAHPRTHSCHHHLPVKHVSRPRNKVGYTSITATSVPTYTGSLPCDPSQLKVVSKAQERDSRASSTSSISSYHSEQTESSLASSGSESIDTSEKDNSERKQRNCIEKASQRLCDTELSTRHKERSRKRVYYSKRADAVPSQRGTHRSRSSDKEQSFEHFPLFEQFADSFSATIMENVRQHCIDNKWLRFMSYHRPIATGNWGCGAYRGNAQLKFVIQWVAASVSQAPALVYYTFNDARLLQAQEIAEIISGKTVGHLAAALRDYCNWVHMYLTSLSATHLSSSTRPARTSPQPETSSHSRWKNQQDSLLPQTLFDFLCEKFQVSLDK